MATEQKTKQEVERNIVPKKKEDIRTDRTAHGDKAQENVGNLKVDAYYALGLPKEINKPHQAHTVFDFSNCTVADLALLSTRYCVISVQRWWTDIAKSDLEAATKPGMYAVVDVKNDIIDSTRGRQQLPPKAAATKALNAMSESERKAWLEAELAKMQQNKKS